MGRITSSPVHARSAVHGVQTSLPPPVTSGAVEA